MIFWEAKANLAFLECSGDGARRDSSSSGPSSPGSLLQPEAFPHACARHQPTVLCTIHHHTGDVGRGPEKKPQEPWKQAWPMRTETTGSWAPGGQSGMVGVGLGLAWASPLPVSQVFGWVTLSHWLSRLVHKVSWK